MLLPVIRRRRHDDRDCKRGETDRGQVKPALKWRQGFLETGAEYGDQLESEERLNSREHGPALLEEALGSLVRRQRFLDLQSCRGPVHEMRSSRELEHPTGNPVPRASGFELEAAHDFYI